MAVLACVAAAAPVQAGPGARAVATTPVAPGLVHQTWVAPGAGAGVHVARRDPGSPVRLQLVQAHDAVGRGLEPTSAMCRRTRGCLLAVNGDFFTPDGAPVGAVVVGGRMLRSPRPNHEQLSLDPLRVTTGGLGDRGWSGQVQLPDRPPLALDGVNVAPSAPDSLVLYTSAYGAATPSCSCVELELAERLPDLPAGTLGRHVPVRVVAQRAGATPLAKGTAVLAGTGAAASALAALAAAPVPTVLHIATAAATSQNVGAHPVLLRDGQPHPYDESDPMLAEPHPRTLVGWDAAGTVWLVASEGRRRGVPGLTAAQAVTLLQSLGASEAVMLDGGGSTTFVAQGRVVGRPSDGAERPVANALVFSWEEPPASPVAVRAAVAPAPVAVAVAADPVPAPPPPVAAPRPAPPRPVAPAVTVKAPAPAAAVAAPPLPRRLPPAGDPLRATAYDRVQRPSEVAPDPTPVAVLLVAAAATAWWRGGRRRHGG